MGDNLPDSKEKTKVKFLQRDFDSAVEKDLSSELDENEVVDAASEKPDQLNPSA